LPLWMKRCAFKNWLNSFFTPSKRSKRINPNLESF
jgi:hypothetical protein